MKKLFIITLLFFSSLFNSNVYAVGAESLLKPDKAFQVLITDVSTDSITATWKIADGYYMYRKRFSFSSDNPAVILGKPEFPEGDLKDDPSFGKVVVYHHNVSVKIPVKNSAGATSIKLKTKSQGCADLGVCYPPQKIALEVNLPASSVAPVAIEGISDVQPIDGVRLSIPDASIQTAIGGLEQSAPATKPSDLAAQLGIPAFGKNSNNQGPLPVEQAFAFDISALDKKTLNAYWQVTPGHYLYQKKIHFRLRDAKGIVLGKWKMPKGKLQKDATYGDTIVYNENFEVKIPLIGKATSVTIKTSYQGCSKLTGICYPPQNKVQTIDLTAAPEKNESTQVATASIAGIEDTSTVNTNFANNKKISEQARFEGILKNNSLLTILGLFFLAGLALTFTPCVFPMIPILSGIISGQGSDISKKKAFILSLAYVLPMALTYAIVGVLAGLSGESLTAALQIPWVIGLFALLFVVLAFSMFGFYELQMPASIQNKLSSVSNQQKGGTFIGAAIMGVLSALIVGPCVTAPLTGALIFIADTKDAFLGGLSLFMLGIGMGVPLLMIGTAAGEILPKAGAWMDKVKAVFGVLMLGLAVWMLERILPIEIIMLLTAALLIGSAIYMKAVDTLDASASGWDRLWKALGIILLVYGIILMLGVAKGNASFFAPLKDNAVIQQVVGSTGRQVRSESLVFAKVKDIKSLDLALENAAAQNKTLMLDFYADWCISCKEMEHKVFSDPRIIQALAGTVLVQADVTENNENDKALMKKFGLFGPPGIMFFDTKKQEHRAYRVVGEMSADKFLAHIMEFLAQSK